MGKTVVLPSPSILNFTLPSGGLAPAMQKTGAVWLPVGGASEPQWRLQFGPQGNRSRYPAAAAAFYLTEFDKARRIAAEVRARTGERYTSYPLPYHLSQFVYMTSATWAIPYEVIERNTWLCNAWQEAVSTDYLAAIQVQDLWLDLMSATVLPVAYVAPLRPVTTATDANAVDWTVPAKALLTYLKGDLYNMHTFAKHAGSLKGPAAASRSEHMRAQMRCYLAAGIHAAAGADAGSIPTYRGYAFATGFGSQEPDVTDFLDNFLTAL